MARPKGIKQQRDPNKYILPDRVELKPGQPEDYLQETKLVFIDLDYGEFVSSFKALRQAKGSTHPRKVQERKEKTNLERYGSKNPSSNTRVKAKRKETMVSLYGVENALENKELLEKSKQTFKAHYGYDHPMQCPELVEKQKESLIKAYGVINPSQSKIIQDKIRETNKIKYGFENAAQSPKVREKALKTLVKNNKRSKGEIELKQFIESLGLYCDKKYLGGNSPREIDIFIPELNIGIEFNGVYFHSEVSKTIYKNYHKDKMLLAKEKGIKLVQIFDFEWEKRNTQVKSFLKSLLKKNQIKLNARESEVKEVPKTEASNFLDKYHILGSCNFIKAFGLYVKNELVSVITIGKHHRNNKELVLSRYCGKDNVSVRGGLSKLTNYAFTIFGPLTTWIDLRFSDGTNWEKIGWKKINVLPPDYFYFNKNNRKIISKQSRKKSVVNTPSNMTEHEHALKDGLLRVYDCGKLKLIFS